MQNEDTGLRVSMRSLFVEGGTTDVTFPKITRAQAADLDDKSLRMTYVTALESFGATEQVLDAADADKLRALLADNIAVLEDVLQDRGLSLE